MLGVGGVLGELVLGELSALVGLFPDSADGIADGFLRRKRREAREAAEARERGYESSRENTERLRLEILRAMGLVPDIAPEEPLAAPAEPQGEPAAPQPEPATPFPLDMLWALQGLPRPAQPIAVNRQAMAAAAARLSAQMAARQAREAESDDDAAIEALLLN